MPLAVPLTPDRITVEHRIVNHVPGGEHGSHGSHWHAACFTEGVTMQFFAYIDGGSGSLILQAALASLLGAAFFFRQVWGRIRERLGGRKNRP